MKRAVMSRNVWEEMIKEMKGRLIREVIALFGGLERGGAAYSRSNVQIEFRWRVVVECCGVKWETN